MPPDDDISPAPLPWYTSVHCSHSFRQINSLSNYLKPTSCLGHQISSLLTIKKPSSESPFAFLDQFSFRCSIIPSGTWLKTNWKILLVTTVLYWGLQWKQPAQKKGHIRRWLYIICNVICVVELSVFIIYHYTNIIFTWKFIFITPGIQ